MAILTNNRSIRKIQVAFGSLFDSIPLVRYDETGLEDSRTMVPIEFAQKEHYVMRLQADPDLDKKIQTALPRMSYDMGDMTYDASRKLNTNTKAFASTSSGTVSQYTPVPYNFDFNLYLYVRNLEDGNQIMEYILPNFTPDYTIKVNMIPEMGIVKEVPIVLNSVKNDVTYETDREGEPRIVIWTLSFTVKGYIFGAISETGLIRTSITNIYNDIQAQDQVNFIMSPTGVGTYKTGEIVFQGYSLDSPAASGKVVAWANNTLTLTGVNGHFVSNKPVYGHLSNSVYTFTAYQVQPKKLVEIDITPAPIDTPANNTYYATTTITEANSTPLVSTSPNTVTNYMG